MSYGISICMYMLLSAVVIMNRCVVRMSVKRPALGDQLQRRAREALLQVLEQHRERVVAEDRVRQIERARPFAQLKLVVENGQRRLLIRVLKEQDHLVLELGRRHPGVDQSLERGGVGRRGHLGVGGREAGEHALDLAQRRIGRERRGESAAARRRRRCRPGRCRCSRRRRARRPCRCCHHRRRFRYCPRPCHRRPGGELPPRWPTLPVQAIRPAPRVAMHASACEGLIRILPNKGRDARQTGARAAKFCRQAPRVRAAPRSRLSSSRAQSIESGASQS